MKPVTGVSTAIEQEIRKLRASLADRDQTIARVAQYVGVKGEALSANDIVGRVRTFRSSLVASTSRLRAIEAVLRGAPCEVDTDGKCHTHGGINACPIAAVRALVSEDPIAAAAGAAASVSSTSGVGGVPPEMRAAPSAEPGEGEVH